MKADLPKIYCIVNIENNEESLILCSKLLKARFALIQIRSKLEQLYTHKISRDILNLRDQLNPSTKIILNDHLELARELKVDGLHLGQNDADPKIARERLGLDSIIGLSCHNLSDLKAAPTDILDYLALGPIFESKSKNGHAPLVGLEKLKEFSELSSLPVVAIGGINLGNARSVLAQGARSCAMIHEIKCSDNLEVLKEEIENF